jgi:hypothetical protein
MLMCPAAIPPSVACVAGLDDLLTSQFIKQRLRPFGFPMFSLLGLGVLWTLWPP